MLSVISIYHSILIVLKNHLACVLPFYYTFFSKNHHLLSTISHYITIRNALDLASSTLTNGYFFFFTVFPHIYRTKSNQRWMKLRTTVQLSSAIQKKPPLKREDSFLKRFSTRQIPETQVRYN